MSSILSKSPIYVHDTIHLRNNGAHHTHYTNVQSEGVEYSRRLQKSLLWGVERLSPSWVDVTNSSKNLYSNSSKSSSSFACCASIARSNFLCQQSMVGEAPTHGKNNRVFRIQLYRQLGCLASKRPVTFWLPPNGLLVSVHRIKMASNRWGCSKQMEVVPSIFLLSFLSWSFALCTINFHMMWIQSSFADDCEHCNPYS